MEFGESPRGVSLCKDGRLQCLPRGVIGRGYPCQVPRLGEDGVSCEDLRWRWCRGKLLEESPHTRGVGFTSPGSPPFASLLLSAGFPARVIFLAQLLTK